LANDGVASLADDRSYLSVNQCTTKATVSKEFCESLYAGAAARTAED
jgi:hypothetical protein